jgi:hypothetical protein
MFYTHALLCRDTGPAVIGMRRSTRSVVTVACRLVFRLFADNGQVSV